MTKRPDLYATLGVPPSATQAEISHAYRTLLRQHHPDTRTPDDESHGAASDTALEQVLAAYAVLHNPARRADYDRQFATPAHQTGRAPQHSQPPIVAGPVRWHRTH